jgi:hypothetical protein
MGSSWWTCGSKRLDYVESVRERVYARMISERKRPSVW